MTEPRTKLWVDFSPFSRLHSRVDDDEDLIECLLTLAGMIMEDISVIALDGRSSPQSKRLEQVIAAGQDIAALASAGLVVIRRSSS